MAALLLIVSRTAPERYAYFKRAGAGHGVDVVLDRRVGSRRQRQVPTAIDLRRHDRRTRVIAEELATNGWAMVTRQVSSMPAPTPMSDRIAEARDVPQSHVAGSTTPCFLRRWVAREGHRAALCQALRLVHETYTRRSPHVIEALMYREHFLGAEFIGFIVYDDEAGLATPERQEELALLDGLDSVHTKFSTPSLRVKMIDEFITVRRPDPYGIAGLLTCQPAFTAEFAERLKRLTAELVGRLRPARLLVGEVIDRPGLFFVLGDSHYAVDLDRYLQSALHRQHVEALGPLLVAPTRWFSLDPVWRYFRGRGD